MIQYICLQLNLKFSLKDSIYLFEIKSCWHLICQTQARPDIMASHNHNYEKCHVMEYIEYDHNCIEHNHNYEKCHPTPRIQLSVRPFVRPFVPIFYMHHTYMHQDEGS